MKVDFLLYFELPFLTDALFREWKDCRSESERERNIEKRTDLLATMLALYPDTETSEISKQLGISEQTVKLYAGMFGVHKSREYRSDIGRKNGSKTKKRTEQPRKK